jgi:glutathione S-transferase
VLVQGGHVLPESDIILQYLDDAWPETCPLLPIDVFPLFHAWLHDFEALYEVRETIPIVERLLEYALGVWHMLLGLAGAAIEIAPGTMDSAGSAVEAAAAANNKNSRGGSALQGRT